MDAPPIAATGAVVAGVEAGVSVGGDAGDVFGDAISMSVCGAESDCASSSALVDAAGRVLATAASPLPLFLP